MHQLNFFIFNEFCRCCFLLFFCGEQHIVLAIIWLFGDSHWIPLANNSTRCNSIPGEKDTFGDKRWSVETLFPSLFVNLLQFAFRYVCTSTVSGLHTIPQVDISFAVSPFTSSLICSPPLIPIHLPIPARNHLFYFSFPKSPTCTFSPLTLHLLTGSVNCNMVIIDWTATCK